MELEIKIDEDCGNCKKSLKYFKFLQKRHRKYYGNMIMEDYSFIDGLFLIPDFNSSGYLTHFHVEKADMKTMKNFIKIFETQKKYCKIMQREIKKKKKVGLMKFLREKAVKK